MIFGKRDKPNNDYWFKDNPDEWDKSRCDPFNRPGPNDCSGVKPYEIGLPEVPNIISITNILGPTPNIKIESPRTPIDEYRIYIKKYKLDGTYLERQWFNTTELSPNIPLKIFENGFIYKVYAIASNSKGDSDRSIVHVVRLEKNRIHDYSLPWVPPGDVNEIMCDLGIGCEDTLVCN